MLLPDAKHFIHRLTTFAQNLENNHGWLQLCCALQLLWVTLTGRIWVCTVHQALCQWKISRQHESHFLVSREKTRGSLYSINYPGDSHPGLFLEATGVTTMPYSLLLWFGCSVMLDSLVAPWTEACLAPLSVGFPRQEHWSGLPSPSPGGLPDPGIEPTSPTLAGGFFTTESPINLRVFLRGMKSERH